MHPLTHTTLVGNWATLLLATNKNGEIDYKRMGDEIDILIASSPCGIYSNGTAGEFYTQNEEEFIKTSELLAEKCSAASIPFQIGVSHMSPQISLNRLQAVKSLNPGAVQVILPDWFPVTLEEAVIFAKDGRSGKRNSYRPLQSSSCKKILSPHDWMYLKQHIPSLIGIKVLTETGIPNGINKSEKRYKDYPFYSRP